MAPDRGTEIAAVGCFLELGGLTRVLSELHLTSLTRPCPSKIPRNIVSRYTACKLSAMVTAERDREPGTSIRGARAEGLASERHPVRNRAPFASGRVCHRGKSVQYQFHSLFISWVFILRCLLVAVAILAWNFTRHHLRTLTIARTCRQPSSASNNITLCLCHEATRGTARTY